MRRWGGHLALAALALQFVLSFGHIHLDGVHRAYPATAATAANAQAPAFPAPQPGNDGDDYCAVCASIYLAASSFVPQAPQLPVPAVSQTVEHGDHATVLCVIPRRTPFQSRAPPLA